MDEPTEGLDHEGCAALYSVMNELTRRKHTIVAISHDPKIIKGAHIVIDLNEKPVPNVSIVSNSTTTADADQSATPKMNSLNQDAAAK